MRPKGQVRLLLKLHELHGKNGKVTEAAFREVEGNLHPSLLSRYRTIKDKKGTAIAVLKDDACSECMMTYPKTHEILRQKDFVQSCEYCGRFLLVAQ